MMNSSIGIVLVFFLAQFASGTEAEKFGTEAEKFVADRRVRTLLSLCIGNDFSGGVATVTRLAGEDYTPGGSYLRVWGLSEWGVTLTIIDLDQKRVRSITALANGKAKVAQWRVVGEIADEIDTELAPEFTEPIQFLRERPESIVGDAVIWLIERIEDEDYKWIFSEINVSGKERNRRITKILKPLGDESE